MWFGNGPRWAHGPANSARAPSRPRAALGGCVREEVALTAAVKRSLGPLTPGPSPERSPVTVSSTQALWEAQGGGTSPSPLGSRGPGHPRRGEAGCLVRRAPAPRLTQGRVRQAGTPITPRYCCTPPSWSSTRSLILGAAILPSLPLSPLPLPSWVGAGAGVGLRLTSVCTGLVCAGGSSQAVAGREWQVNVGWSILKNQ